MQTLIIKLYMYLKGLDPCGLVVWHIKKYFFLIYNFFLPTFLEKSIFSKSYNFFLPTFLNSFKTGYLLLLLSFQGQLINCEFF